MKPKDLRWRGAVLALTAVLVAACSGGTAKPTGGAQLTTASTATAQSTASTSTRSRANNPKPCLNDADISGPVGFAVALLKETVKVTPSGALCTYQPTDKSVGTDVSITIAIGPASVADQVVSDFTTAARARSGKDAKPLAVGDRGLVFGSSLSSGAFAVKGDRVVAIDIGSPFTNIGDKKSAAVEILKKVIG